MRALARGRVLIQRPPIKESFFRDSSFTVSRLAHFGPVTDRDLPNADVIIASWWETAEWISTLDVSKGAKVYFIQHGEFQNYLPVERCQSTYRLPFHKIVVAPWLRRMMNDQYDDATVDVVPNSVDRTQFFATIRGKQPVPSVGFLYSTDPVKGLNCLIMALELVKKRISNLRCISFGRQRPGRQLSLPRGTEFYHSPPQDQIRNVYASCDAWITPSRSEGFNLPAIEAMACRTPVVSTRTGWPEEAIKPSWNGALVDVDDVYGLAQGIEWVLTRNNEDWRRLSDNALATASVGSWDESAAMFEAALEHACRRTARGEIPANVSVA